MEFFNKFDVMIVGAGPAGISTLLHLQKYAPTIAGKTIVIEKAVFPRSKLCAGGVGGWSESILKQLKIKLEIPSLFISDVEFRFRDQHWVYHSPRQFRMVQRADFDHALVKKAHLLGLAIRENERFVAMNRRREDLIVRTTKGVYSVKAIVGADGALSMVRKSIMRPYQSCLAPTIQITAPVDPEYDMEFIHKKAVIDYSPIDEGVQGYCWHFPGLQNGKPHMTHGIGNTRFLPDRSRAPMKGIFRRVLHARKIEINSGCWSSFPSRIYSHNVPISTANILLVGDAAGIEPAFGGGIHMALSYGDIAAKTLSKGFETHDFSFQRYRDDVMGHFMGRHMRDCMHLARRMYGGKENPLEILKQFFSGQFARRDLLSLFLRPKSSPHQRAAV